MKKILFNLIILVFSFTSLLAQNIPQGINYQAVARDADGQLLSDIPISIKITLISNIERRGVAYSEIHNVITNKFGLFNFTIGQGEPTKGNFEEIPWESEEIWLEVAMDEKAGFNFKEMNTTKLLTVPYAFHAGSANQLVPINPNGDGRVPWWGQPWWNIEGLEKTNPDKHFVGNIDSVDLVFRTNNLERLRIKANGEIVMPGDVEIGGSLEVKGDSTIVQNLYVQGHEAVIDSFLFVGEDASFGDNISIVNNITAGGDGTFNNIHVLNNGTIDNDFTVGGRSGLNGQVTIDANVGGGQSSYDAYPLRVQGSDQGIAVKINGTRDNSNNFMTFWDDNGRQGRIEGQTLSELQNSFNYIWWHEQEALNTAFQIAMVAVDIVGLDDGDAAIVEGIEMVDIISNWAVVTVDWENKVGIAFESGSGDYAEWLQKASLEETFSFGDIVGVRGGKVSKTMANPNHYMVVSKSPIVLGNMPPEGQEINYEKIAFMGQVAVKVRGKVNVGDYIIASSLSDGFGIAVNPQKITLDQYERIVGVAWSESDNALGISMINVAVGINTNDAVNKIQQQDEELKSVKNQLNTVIAYLQSKDPSFDATLFEVSEVENKDEAISSELENLNKPNQFDRKTTIDKMVIILQDNPEVLSKILADARQLLDEKGIDYNRFEQTKRIITDEKYFLNVLQEFNTINMEEQRN